MLQNLIRKVLYLKIKNKKSKFLIKNQIINFFLINFYFFFNKKNSSVILKKYKYMTNLSLF
jgi:hypothetical protein